MKLIFIVIVFLSFDAKACKNLIPISEAQRYIAAAPAGVAGLFTCSEKPLEECLCFDGIESWSVAAITEIDGAKTLVNDPAKKAAYDAEKLAKEQAVIAEAIAKEEIKQDAEDFDPKDIKSLADVAAELAKINKIISTLK